MNVIGPGSGIFYDRNGKPIDVGEWDRLHADYRYLVVSKTNLGDRVEVSTVWLGLNHQWTPGAPPLIFETMVFDRGEGSEYCERYSTEAEAIEGHLRIVDFVMRARAEMGEVLERRDVPVE